MQNIRNSFAHAFGSDWHSQSYRLSPLLPLRKAFSHSRKLMAGSLAAVILIAGSSVAKLHAADSDDDFFLEMGNKTVVTRSGDTLQSLADQQYGSRVFWRLIAEHNGLNPTVPLNIGQVIELPLFVQREFEYATAAFIKGQVLLIKEGEAVRQMERNDRVFLTDVIETGDDGFASLSFRSGTIVNVQPQSMIQLIKLRCLEDDSVCTLGIDAIQGEINSDVQRSGEQPTDFSIITPYATAAVRGTRFDFEADPAMMIVGVTEGNVDIVTQGSSSPVDTGFGVLTAEGQAPGDPVELIGPPTFRGIPPRVAEGDKISWWRVPDGERYIVSLAHDAAVQQVVTQSSQGDQVFQIGSVEAGDYFINVRPVDDNGLKGFGTSQQVSVVDIDGAVGVFPLAADRQGQDVTLSVVTPTNDVTGYEFQISDSNDFSDVISVDVGTSGQAIFRNTSGNMFARARALIGTNSVSEFGPLLEVN